MNIAYACGNPVWICQSCVDSVILCGSGRFCVNLEDLGEVLGCSLRV